MKSKDWQKILLQDLLKKADDMENKEEGIDSQIMKIQNSTKASLKLFCPIHDRLRMKYAWYYKWHLNPWSKLAHAVVLSCYIAALGVFAVNFLYGNKVNQTKAGLDFATDVTEKNIDYSKIYTSIPEGSTEVAAKRTENQKVFSTPDGKQQYIISSGPIHYKDGNNSWKNIDSSIVAKEDGSGFEMNKSIYSAEFGKNFLANPLVQIQKDGQNLSVKPGELSLTNGTDNQTISAPTDVEGESNGHEVSYKNAYGTGLDFGYETQDLQLNKKLTINSLDSLPAPTIDMSNEANSNIGLNLQLSISEGIELFIEDVPWNGQETTIENKNLIFKKDGKTIWQLTPAKAWDAKGREKAITGKSIISKTGNLLNLQVQFPYSFLKTAKYPVTIDPDTYYGATTDATIYGDEFSSYAAARLTSASLLTSGVLIVGQTDLGDEWMVFRSYLEFDTSGIDDSSTISLAKLNLTATSDASAIDFSVRIHKYDWTSPVTDGNREANFDGALASTYDADWRSTTGMSVNTSYASSNLNTAWVKKLAGEKTRYALLSSRDVGSNLPTVDEDISLASQENATQAYRPYLSITIEAPAPSPPVSRYWIDSDGGNWNDTANWSDASGGSGGASVPVAGDTAIFDNAGGTHNGALTIDTAVDVGILTFDTNYTGAITQGANTITTSTAMSLTGTDLTMGAAVTANGTLTIGSDKTLNLAGNALSVAGAFTNNGTIQLKGSETITGTPTLAANSTVTYNDTAASSVAIKNWTYQNLTISASGGSYKMPTANLTLGGNFTITAGTFNTNNSTDRNLTVSGNVSVSGTLNANNSTITCGGNWDDSAGIFTYGGSTVVMTGNNKAIIQKNTNYFYDIIVGSGGVTTILGSDISVQNVLTIATSGFFTDNHPSGAYWVKLYKIGMNSGESPLVLNGAFKVEAGNFDACHLAFYNGGTNISIPGGTYYGYTLFYPGNNNANATYNLAGAIINTKGSFKLYGSSGGSYTTTINTNNYQLDLRGLEYQTGGSNSIINAGSSTINIQAVPGLTIVGNGNNVFNAQTSTINLTGAFSNSLRTFNGNSSTINFTNTATKTITSGSGTTFNNLNHSAGASTLQLVDAINIDGNFSNSSGTFNANGQNMNVGGNWANTATFTAGSNTVTFDGGSGSIQTISDTTTFYNLTFDSAAGAKTIKTTAGTTQTVGAGGTLSLSGAASDKRITYQSTTDGGAGGDQFTFVIPANITNVNYVNARDFVASTHTIAPVVANCTDNHNNSGWLFNANPNTPSALGPLAMTNGSWGKDNTPDFNFTLNDSDGSDTVKYQIQISVNANFSSPAIDYTSALAAQGSKTYTASPALADGTYYWQVKAIDNSLAESAWADGGSFKIDTVNPTASQVASPVSPNGSNGYYKTTAPSVTLSGADTGGSGVSSIKYRWGVSGDYSTYGAPLTAPLGINTLYYYAVDNAANDGSGSPNSQEYKVDATVPTTDIYLAPTDPDGTNSYYVHAPTVTFTSDDGSGSGASTIYYRWGGSGDFSAYSAGIQAPEGTNTIYYYGTDLAGNSGLASPFTREIKVDTIVPSVSAVANPVGPNGSNNYYTGVAPTITLSATDPSSPSTAISYKWDSASYGAYTVPLTASNGTHTLYYYATDDAGLSGAASPSSVTYNVDTNNPSIEVLASPAAPNGSNGYYKTSAPSITLTATDATSTPSVKYKWDSGQYTTTSSPANISASEGTHTLYYSAVDSGGNASEESNQIYYVDLTNPVVDIFADPADPDGGNSYYKTVPEITFTSSDGGSGSPVIYYHWDSNEDSTYSTGLNAPEGHHIIHYHAIDRAGNSTADITRDYYVDTTGPTASQVVSPASPNGESGYYKTTAPAITLSGADAGSGVASLKYRWGGSGDYSTYSTPLTASEGTNTLYYYSVDVAGNDGSSLPDSAEYKVDITSTVTDISLLPADPTGDNGYYRTAPTITLSATDATSGLSAIKYYWNNEAEATYSAELTAPEGDNILYYYSVDNAGNIQTPVTREIKVDHIAPITNTEAPTAPASNGTASFSWKAAVDNGAGVAGYLVYIGSLPDTYNLVNGEFTATNSFKHTFSQNGTYYIRVKAKGTAGNLGGYSDQGTVSVDVDNPLVSISNLINNQFVGTKTFNIFGTSSDELSGISKVELNFDGANDWAAASSTDNYSTWNYAWANYTDGSHKVLARAVDGAGNIKASAEFIAVVDTTGPALASDLRVFNISNSTAQVYAVYLDFAESKDDLSGVKNYEVYRGDTKVADISSAKDASNKNFTGNANQPYFLVDSGLASGSYSYKVKAIDNVGNSSETAPTTIDTSGKQVENDSVSDAKGTASSVVGRDKTSAIISWKTTYPASSLVEYGESASYGKKTEIDESLNQGHSVMIPDLKPGTAYHAKATSKDIYGREMATGDISFTTGVAPEDKSALKIIMETLQNLFRNLTVRGASPQETDMASLQGLSNNLLVTDVSFKEKALYQNILTFEKGKKIEKGTDGKNFSAVSTDGNNYFLDKNLSQGTSYYYRLDEGAPVVRKPLVGDDSPLGVTEAAPIKESVLVTKDKVQLTLSWKTNRGATSQVELGTTSGYGQKTKEDTSLNMGHTVVLEDLAPDTAYHFKAVSKDAKNNSAASEDFTFTTPAVQKDKSPLDIVIESLQRMLRFFQK